MAEAIEYYLRGDILAELYRATRVRDVTFVYGTGDGPDTRVALHPGSAAELRGMLRETFTRFRDCLIPYPWFTIGVDDESEATAYAGKDRHHIGWDAAIEFDYGWRCSFGELRSGMAVLDDFGIHYRVKFSGHRSLHFCIPSEAMPDRFRAQPRKAQWYEAVNRVGSFVGENSRHLRHGWGKFDEEELMYSAPYSLHRDYGLGAVPLLPDDVGPLRPWMANIHLVSPVPGWWDAPEDAGRNFERLLARIDADSTVVDMGGQPQEGRPRCADGYCLQVLGRARRLVPGHAHDNTHRSRDGVGERRLRAWDLLLQEGGSTSELQELAGDDDSAVAWFALEALNRRDCGPEATSRQMVSGAWRHAMSEHEYLRQAALDAVCRAGPNERRKLYRMARTSQAALWTIADWIEEVGEAAVREALRLLSDESRAVCGAAIQVLGRLSPLARGRFVESLSHSATDACLKAACALLEQQKGAIPVLEAAVEAAEGERRALLRCIVEGFRHCGSWRCPSPKITVVMQMDARVSLSLLRYCALYLDKKARFFAFTAMREHGALATEVLVEMLADPGVELRRRACEVLRDTAPSSAFEALLVALRDEDVKVRQNAVRALAKIGLRTAHVRVREAVLDPARAVGRAAREALAGAHPCGQTHRGDSA